MGRLLFSLRWFNLNHWTCELEVYFGFLLGRQQQQQKLRAALSCVGSHPLPLPSLFPLWSVLLTLVSSTLEESCSTQVSPRP